MRKLAVNDMVLLISEENRALLVGKQIAIHNDDADSLAYLIAANKVPDKDELVDKIVQLKQAYPNRRLTLAIDTMRKIYTAWGIKSVNDNQEVSAVLDYFAELAEQQGIAVALLHHLGKPDVSGKQDATPLGATFQEAGVDTSASLDRDGETTSIVWQGRYGEGAQSYRLVDLTDPDLPAYRDWQLQTYVDADSKEGQQNEQALTDEIVKAIYHSHDSINTIVEYTGISRSVVWNCIKANRNVFTFKKLHQGKDRFKVCFADDFHPSMFVELS